MKDSFKDKQILFSTLWVFLTLNYLYCDVLTLMSAEMLNALLTGTVGGMEMNETTLLGAGVIMEISIAMVLVSRIASYKLNRISNIIAGTIKTIIMIGTLMMGEPALHYMFFATIEIATSIFIAWHAWQWKNNEIMKVD
ncbi:DUF6326 family protein [Reichenbachiella sp.]|uniref:DUF6326 family protein n=1 Tax=Reichenbachiella sp. TaxID=2184521 RepID=UPI003BB0C864